MNGNGGLCAAFKPYEDLLDFTELKSDTSGFYLMIAAATVLKIAILQPSNKIPG